MKLSYRIQGLNANPLLCNLQIIWDKSGIGIRELQKRSGLPAQNIHHLFITGTRSDVKTSTYLKLIRGLNVTIKGWGNLDIDNFLEHNGGPSIIHKDKQGQRYCIQAWNKNPIILELQLQWHNANIGVSEFARLSHCQRISIHRMFITASTDDIFLSSYLRMYQVLKLKKGKWKSEEIADYLARLD